MSVQEAAGEAPAALLATVRALAAELDALLPRPVSPGGRVTVLMPAPLHTAGAASGTPLPSSNLPGRPAPQPEPAPVPEPPAPIPEPQPTPAPEVSVEASATPAPETENRQPETENRKSETENRQPETYSIRPPATPHFDALAEVPTLAQQTPPPPSKEVFELHTPGESLNDRLKREETELAHKLVDTPIKDLRKGIGINDRYLFISELFRGDESMYERSIKTINAFHILPEAEYWINRELKVKLGWDDGPTVRHFDQLVRRRFS
ncbi:hypothetical protein GCM10028786_14160 [Flaviaesturariibacter terrae]